jgi:hypothetical protein
MAVWYAASTAAGRCTEDNDDQRAADVGFAACEQSDSLQRQRVDDSGLSAAGTATGQPGEMARHSRAEKMSFT